MNDEIKKILEGLNHISNSGENASIGFNSKDCKLLSNYITNLQEENERLKEQLEYLRSNEYLNQVKWERDFNEKIVEDYKSRIDKAIDKLYCYGEVFNKEILKQFQKEMLNILNGGDE